VNSSNNIAAFVRSFSSGANRGISADVTIYFAANLVTKGIGFVMAPVFASYLAPDDFGRISVFLSLCGIATVFVGYNSNGAVLLRVLTENRVDLPAYVGTVVATIAVVSAIILALSVLLGGAASTLIQLPKSWIVAAVIVGALNAITAVALAVWQAQRRATQYAAINLGQSLLNAALSALLVISMNLGWRGRADAVLVSAIISTAIALWLLVNDRLISTSFDPNALRDSSSYGIPLIPHALAAWIMEGLDRLWLGSAASLQAVGVYSAGYQVGMIVAVAASSANTALAPVILRDLGSEAASRGRLHLVRRLYLLMFAFFLIAFVLTLTAKLITAAIFPPSYAEAAAVIGWVAAGYACHATYMLLGNLVTFSRKTHLLSAITVSCAVLNVALNAFLIPRNGSLGAAQATFLTYFSFMALTWVVSQRVCPMPWIAGLSRA
jgi:O-antigen/teichoic acid export membrane protein